MPTMPKPKPDPKSGPTKMMGVEFAPLRLPLNRRLQTAMVAFYISMFFLTPPLCVWATIYITFYSSYWYLAAFYAIWFYYDFDTPKRGGRTSEWVKNWGCWIHLRDYFPIHLVKTAELDPERNYIFGYHPHGITSVGAFINFAVNANGFQKMFPGIKSTLITLVGQYWFPLRRDFLLFFDCADASKESLQYLLSQKTKGHAVVIVIGGASEAMDAGSGNYKLTLKRRKGFIKQAIKLGADLVPTYSFGENDLFGQVESSPESRLKRFQQFVKSYTGIPPVLVKGRGVFNYTIGVMPYRRPIYTVVGAPIRVEQCEEPSIEQINELHAKYIEGLTAVFENYKTKYGVPEEAHLEIDF